MLTTKGLELPLRSCGRNRTHVQAEVVVKDYYTFYSTLVADYIRGFDMDIIESSSGSLLEPSELLTEGEAVITVQERRNNEYFGFCL